MWTQCPGPKLGRVGKTLPLDFGAEFNADVVTLAFRWTQKWWLVVEKC